MSEESVPNSYSLCQSFSILLDQCLRLDSKDKLLVIYDQSLDPIPFNEA